MLGHQRICISRPSLCWPDANNKGEKPSNVRTANIFGPAGRLPCMLPDANSRRKSQKGGRQSADCIGGEIMTVVEEGEAEICKTIQRFRCFPNPNLNHVIDLESLITNHNKKSGSHSE